MCVVVASERVSCSKAEERLSNLCGKTSWALAWQGRPPLGERSSPACPPELSLCFLSCETVSTQRVKSQPRNLSWPQADSEPDAGGSDWDQEGPGWLCLRIVCATKPTAGPLPSGRPVWALPVHVLPPLLPFFQSRASFSFFIKEYSFYQANS